MTEKKKKRKTILFFFLFLCFSFFFSFSFLFLFCFIKKYYFFNMTSNRFVNIRNMCRVTKYSIGEKARFALWIRVFHFSNLEIRENPCNPSRSNIHARIDLFSAYRGQLRGIIFIRDSNIYERTIEHLRLALLTFIHHH